MAADWKSLQAAIDGRVVLPDSSDYDSARTAEMARYDAIRPEAVVFCASPADIAATIAFVRRHGLPTAIRSGRHSVAGRSTTDGVVVDVTLMDTVSVEDGVATVGAGARLGPVDDALQEHGVTIPSGGSHSVGIAGLTLGGGLGNLGRERGLTCDNLVRAQVVLADGQVVTCDEHDEADLFWGLRGAGGGHFGVVTSLVFATAPAPPTTVFHLVWPLSAAEELIQAWQEWAPSGPDELDASLRLSASGDPDRIPLADVFGTVVGSSEADAAKLLDELVAITGADPMSASRRHVPYRVAKHYLDGLEPAEEWRGEDPPTRTPPARPLLSTKSEFFRRLLPHGTIAALVENLSRGLVPGESREVSFLPWGGAYNRVPVDATAFVHRDEKFLIQHLVALDAGSAGSAPDWLSRSWSLVHRWGSGGVYPNFPDPDLQDWAGAYYGENYDRLRHVKAKYDPDGFFRFHQSIPGDR